MNTTVGHTYPFTISPAINEVYHRWYTFAAVDTAELATCRFEHMPNLALTFLTSTGEDAVIWLRVDPTVPDNGHSVWPFSFEQNVFDFARNVASKYQLTSPHAQSKEGKANRTAIKNLMHLLFNPWTSTHQGLDPAPAIRILRTTLSTTKFSAWGYKDKPLPSLKDKQVRGLCGYFKLCDRQGFFVIDAMVGSIGHSQLSDENRAELLTTHRTHIMKCWPFIKDDELVMEYYDHPFNNLYEVNGHTGMLINNMAANMKLAKTMFENKTGNDGVIA